MKGDKVRTRFAPSPTGYLHIGGLRTALYGYLFAKKSGGDFILRIEDTDLQRYVEGSVELIYSTLKDAGIIYDEGPDAGGGYGPYIQSQRKDIYIKYARELVKTGGAYYCFCGKERLEGLTDENGNRKYDKKCLKLSKAEVEKNLKSGMPYVIRQNIPEDIVSSYTDMVFGEISVAGKDMEDGVLLKSDGMPTYNFANVVDDHLMGINYVMRGTEYLSSTPKYNLIYDSFGWKRPVYIHMPPIMKNATEKLSKRNGAASYADFIEKGYVKEAVVNYIALLGWSPKSNKEKLSMSELKELFSLEGINKSAAIFDEAKMRWLSGEYIKEMPDGEFLKLAGPYLDKSKLYGKGYDYKKLIKILKPRVELLTEIPEKVNFLEEFEKYDIILFENQKMKLTAELAKTVLPLIINALSDVKEFNYDNIHAAFAEVVSVNGLKNGQVFYTARVALSGKESTAGGGVEIAEILGKEESLRRLRFSLSLL